MKSIYIGFLLIPSILSSWGFMSDADYLQIADDSQSYYAAFSSPIPMDSLFMLTLIAEKQDFSQFNLDNIINLDYQDDPFIRFIDQTAIISQSALEKTVINNEEFSPLNKAMIKALYCDIYDYYQEDFDDLLEFRNDGYGDTHVLSTIYLLKANNCFDKEVLEQYSNTISETILNTHDGSFSDLNSEKVVVLYWSGYGNLVEKKWIQVIADNQNNDFGWGKNGSSNPHTTGLSALALIYYAEHEDQQIFFPVPEESLFAQYFRSNN